MEAVVAAATVTTKYKSCHLNASHMALMDRAANLGADQALRGLPQHLKPTLEGELSRLVNWAMDLGYREHAEVARITTEERRSRRRPRGSEADDFRDYRSELWGAL